MRISLLLLAPILLVCPCCEKTSTSTAPKPKADFVELIISIESDLESHCIIELDKQSPRHKGVRSYSSSIDRDLAASVAFCYVGEYDFMGPNRDESNGKLIAVEFTQKSPTSNKVIHTETVYCKYTGSEQTLIDKDGIKIVIKKADTHESPEG